MLFALIFYHSSLSIADQFDSEAEEYDGSSDSQIAAESDVENGVFEEDDDYHPNRPHNRRLRPGQWQRNKSEFSSFLVFPDSYLPLLFFYSQL